MRKIRRRLRPAALNSSKRTALAKASDFASRDTQNESSVRSRPSPPRLEHSHSEPSSGRVELIDENGGDPGVSLGNIPCLTTGDASNKVFERSPNSVHGQEHGGKSVNYLT